MPHLLLCVQARVGVTWEIDWIVYRVDALTWIVVFVYVYCSACLCACTYMSIWILCTRWSGAKQYLRIMIRMYNFWSYFEIELWVFVYSPVYLFLQILSALKVITVYITESSSSAAVFKSLAGFFINFHFCWRLAAWTLIYNFKVPITAVSLCLISSSVYAVQRFTSVLLEEYITYFVFIKH